MYIFQKLNSYRYSKIELSSYPYNVRVCDWMRVQIDKFLLTSFATNLPQNVTDSIINKNIFCSHPTIPPKILVAQSAQFG